ncbi:MAG: hypothetical protein KAJ18_06455 [Candidatus Omnitrophica bacterium]|nr:hypothetical protein [Candidatus Omnitrophota bacterium]
MVKKKYVFFLSLIILFCQSPNAYSFPPQQRKYDNTLLETGTSTKDILPLLEKIASVYGAYCERIYGQYRRGYVLVFLNSNGKVLSVKELEDLGSSVTRMIMNNFPESEGRVEFKPSASDSWDSFKIVFNKGNITSKELSPNPEVIQTRQSLMGYKPSLVANKPEEICDLNEGKVSGLLVGEFKDAREVIDAIGNSPSSTALWLTFAESGLEVILEQQISKSRVIEFRVWYSADDPSGIYNTKFNGEYNPALTNNETDESIMRKFGFPDRVESNFYGSSRYFYKKKYGELIFDFDERSRLNLITVRLKN